MVKIELDADAKYKEGLYEKTLDEQKIAFWINTIDTYACVVESHEQVTGSISQTALDLSGTSGLYEYMGAVRGGFHKTLDELPSNIQKIVKSYYEKRFEETNDIVGVDVLDTDLVFSRGDPFEYI
jgi:translation elongation factor EF-1beta